jgi:glucosamine-6-phosphate deaminase
MSMQLLIFRTSDDVAQYLADEVVYQVKRHPRSVLGLATGSTPTDAYRRLCVDYSQHHTDYSQISTFNLDEYFPTSANDENSYYSYMKKHLFNHINIDFNNIHFPQPAGTETSPSDYDVLIDQKGGLDLLILGIGENGHIGFNEPGTEKESITRMVHLDPITIKNNSRFFKSVHEVPNEAITMGIQTILKARKIILVATGINKANIIQKFLFGPITSEVPATYLKQHDNVVVLLDREAARNINRRMSNEYKISTSNK